MPLFTTTANCSEVPSGCCSPLHFQPVDHRTSETLKRFLPLAETQSCDYTIGGILMWADYFKYEYCIVADTLFIKGLSQDGSGMPAFALPCGALPLKDAVMMLRRYCIENNIKLLFSGIPADRLDAMRRCGECRVTELSEWADYIYDAQALATLSGKAYNKKRNHVNRFIADNPGYQLLPLNADTIPTAHELVDRIYHFDHKTNPEMAAYELEHCRGFLDHYDEGCYVGALLTDSTGRQAIAFTAGEINGDTLILHIEKANHEIAGTGEAVNQLFAQRITESNPEIRYINREDDSGDEGLRRAKQSYHPAYMLAKYNVEFI